jgi:hypothetical protein
MRFTYESIARPGTRLQTARALENPRGRFNSPPAPRRKIEQPEESEMLAEPCRSVLTESSRRISK